MSQKLVVVLGATGTQGSAVVTALLKHGGYAIRAITRSPDSPAGSALKAKGIDVVSANAADKDSLIKAFQGAYAVFGITIPFTEDNEELQGRNIVDAAKADKVPLLIWSSLPSASEVSNGKYTTIYHFDRKSAVDKYISIAGQPTVIIHTGAFAENLFKFYVLKPDPTNPNKWSIGYPNLRPEVKTSGIWIGGDLGNIVVAVIDHWENESWRQRLTNEPLIAAPYEISAKETVDIMTKVTGKEVTYGQTTDFSETVKAAFSFADDGFYRFPNQSNILKELGVKTHSYEDYVREVVAPYMQSKQ
ncbi:NAD(P)-binding protein [Calocera viscosa TUFC12733]|uniref:NAD(P)-binding protein n=1 Tax=Calocera viscosa (strain TUFC12733) TaxID=1330018 RepID=A0A167KLQ5_CALVF|nr:NAD(P)-binding protein [Calocera viscosa TUFC12733]